MAGPQLAAGRQDRRAAAPVDRAVDAAAAEQRGVRGVHDRVDVLLGDVTLHCHDVHVPSLPQPAPVFETDRLVVRDWRDDDAARMFDMYSRDEVVQFLGSVPTPMPSLEAAHARIERGRLRNDAERAAGRPFGWWAVRGARVRPGRRHRRAGARWTAREDADAPVEVAWHLHPDAQGHGYATEAAGGTFARAHDAGIAEVLALTDEANTRVAGGLPPTRSGAARGLGGVLRQAADGLGQHALSVSSVRRPAVEGTARERSTAGRPRS